MSNRTLEALSKAGFTYTSHHRFHKEVCNTFLVVEQNGREYVCAQNNQNDHFLYPLITVHGTPIIMQSLVPLKGDLFPIAHRGVSQAVREYNQQWRLPNNKNGRIREALIVGCEGRSPVQVRFYI